MTELVVGNARIHYRAEGDGPALVLVHGGGPGSVIWDAISGRFADRHTVLVPDLAGSEQATDGGGDLTLDALAEQLAAVIEHSGAAPVDVLGFSLGAAASAALAATRPELVRRLILVAGWTHPGDEYFRNSMAVWLSLAGDAEAFGRYAAVLAHSRRHLNNIGREAVEQATGFMRPTTGILRQLDLARRVDLRDLLPDIQAETLVIGCAHDALIPVQNARELHAAIAGSAYAELDSGHVFRAEQPEEFVRLVGDFLHPATATATATGTATGTGVS
ncbi:alpha/beta fold hydrolase [Embleya sp. AB8]|uniref:alpha/beta fold hydrolase n=1 Tax=Embleya sp. AB8 TaxID=3156304 RepID=UPI003C74A0B4